MGRLRAPSRLKGYRLHYKTVQQYTLHANAKHQGGWKHHALKWIGLAGKGCDFLVNFTMNKAPLIPGEYRFDNNRPTAISHGVRTFFHVAQHVVTPFPTMPLSLL